ncbi:hypothetical protein MuYL_2616 [Mucilaginibacter xinganensis]|uniref:Uncharacterized protein n=1 Tax=Mucilaginibacter xinganensis TaxID=1234841 RepID=A0A223NXA4_9SPHI|nr:hypothetical protein MuYL_2616 [Mucilaginibacter xinganensis]
MALAKEACILNINSEKPQLIAVHMAVHYGFKVIVNCCFHFS